MKSTGVIRNLDDLGRYVIPMEIRKSLDIKEKDPIEFFMEGDSIILKKFEACCTFCGATKDIIRFKGKNICLQCADGIIQEIQK